MKTYYVHAIKDGIQVNRNPTNALLSFEASDKASKDHTALMHEAREAIANDDETGKTMRLTYKTIRGTEKTIYGHPTYYPNITMLRHEFRRHGLLCRTDYEIHVDGNVTVQTATGRRTVGHVTKVIADET